MAATFVNQIFRNFDFDESVVAPLFLPFLAYMGPFLVIFWVLEVAHSGTFLPKYAHGSEEDWEKRKFTVPSKMSMEQ